MSTFSVSPISPLLRRGREQRILSLHFPFLSTDRIARQRWGRFWRSQGRPEHPPVVCAGQERNAIRLLAIDELAMKMGLRSGQGVTEARAMIPEIDVVEADPSADLALLDAIADWCDRYTPLVAHDGREGLFLDITGSAHLFGGEKNLFDDVVSRLFHMGFFVRAAISSTPGLSHAVSRYGEPDIVAPDGAENVLVALPVRALRLGENSVALLVKSGLRQVGDLMGQPRAPLARRFGQDVLLRLDQALGLEDEPISPRRPVAELSAERKLAEPVGDEESILALALKLAESLKRSLEERGQGGRLFELLLFRVDGRVFSIRAGVSAPLREPVRVQSLFKARLDAIHDDFDAGYGFETFRLNVLEAAPFEEVQKGFDGQGRKDDTLYAFIDRMSARFGSDILTTPAMFESHVPERAGRLMPLSEGWEKPPVTPVEPVGERPVRMLVHPEPVETTAEVPDGPPRSFRWRRTSFRVARAEGPERIAPEWWVDGEASPARDYFRIEDDAGRRYWLYRQGLYERHRGEMPRWFIHGIFA